MRLQLETEKNRMRDCRQEWEIKEAGLVRQGEEGQFRARQKGEDISFTLKGLREENTQLQC